MTPEEIFKKYGDIEPVIGKVRELRISPNGLRTALLVPEGLVRDGKRWLAVYFIDAIGLTIALLSDDEVSDWRTVFRDRPVAEG